MTKTLKLAALAAAATTGFASAATLLQGEFQTIGDVNSANNTTNPGISVTAGSEGYSTGADGLGTGGLDGSFNNPIVDYGFYTTTSSDAVIAESFGGAASLITTTVSSGTNSNVQGSSLDLWAGTTPDGTFSNADQTSVAKPLDVTGTINISSLTNGSLYMFFGTRVGDGDTYDITFSLTGAGQTTLNLSQLDITNLSLGGTANNAMFVYRADFTDVAAYDTLTYTVSVVARDLSEVLFCQS